MEIVSQYIRNYKTHCSMLPSIRSLDELLREGGWSGSPRYCEPKIRREQGSRVSVRDRLTSREGPRIEPGKLTGSHEIVRKSPYGGLARCTSSSQPLPSYLPSQVRQELASQPRAPGRAGTPSLPHSILITQLQLPRLSSSLPSSIECRLQLQLPLSLHWGQMIQKH